MELVICSRGYIINNIIYELENINIDEIKKIRFYCNDDIILNLTFINLIEAEFHNEANQFEVFCEKNLQIEELTLINCIARKREFIKQSFIDILNKMNIKYLLIVNYKVENDTFIMNKYIKMVIIHDCKLKSYMFNNIWYNIDFFELSNNIMHIVNQYAHDNGRVSVN